MESLFQSLINRVSKYGKIFCGHTTATDIFEFYKMSTIIAKLFWPQLSWFFKIKKSKEFSIRDRVTV